MTLNNSLPIKFTDIDSIIVKNSKNVTFRDIICLFFYAVELESETDVSEWITYYSEFIEECKMQSDTLWPIIETVKNNFYKRSDFLTCNTYFIKSTNFLTLLYRLFYIESIKLNTISDSDNYKKVLDYQPNNLNTFTKNVTINMLAESLKICLQHYVKIYSDRNKFENKLAEVMLNQL